jgi:hypothetical protein
MNRRGFRYSLIAAEAFVRGMRNSGYRSTATALNETGGYGRRWTKRSDPLAEKTKRDWNLNVKDGRSSRSQRRTLREGAAQ